LSVLVYIFAFRDARPASAVESRAREIDSARRDLEKELTERKAVEFYAVGRFFKEFDQVSDEDVIKILASQKANVAAVG